MNPLKHPEIHSRNNVFPIIHSSSLECCDTLQFLASALKTLAVGLTL